MPDQDSSQPSEFWLYGYGYAETFLTADSYFVINAIYRSLIWKPPPHFGKSPVPVLHDQRPFR